MNASAAKVPLGAAWLGGLGAVPFIGLAVATPFLTDAPRLLAAHGLVAYGATILSFLGGVHWGLAIGSETSLSHRELQPRLILSVIPSLAAWAALLFPPTTGLLILALSIAAMLLVDLRNPIGPGAAMVSQASPSAHQHGRR